MSTTGLSWQDDEVIVGVDTHQRTHHAVALDHTGGVIADQEFPASQAGDHALLAWAQVLGTIGAIGIESTGSYGAGLTRTALAGGHEVIEVNRPAKAVRARAGKSDPIDAESAARAVLAGTATARPKVSTGVVESIRTLKLTRDSAVKSRTAALLQLRDLVTTAPNEIRDILLPLTAAARVSKAAALRPDPARLEEPAHAVRHALRTLARRVQYLEDQIADTDSALSALVEQTVPTLVAARQIGTQTAAALLICAGQNLDRFASEASFAKLTGAAPLPASSGKTHRVRLNRGGDRQANKALHLVAVGRLRSDQRTREYAERRRAQGLSTPDILRCLKRALVRESFNALKTDLLQA